MGTCAFLSFRLGLSDGVSIVAANWAQAFERLGFDTRLVAADGPVDVTVAGLGMDAADPPSRGELEEALRDADLVVVENLLSIPLNLPASRVVSNVLAGRPAILHHHDPPWQRERFAHIRELPATDPAWAHVTINNLTRSQMANRDIEATTIYNGFEIDPQVGDRIKTRAVLGVEADDLLCAHPVRAIARKNIPGAIATTEALDGVYWLLGRAEEGYDDTLAEVLSAARCRVERAPAPSRSDIYAAADVVLFPSFWEGFGNPPIEAAIFERPVVVGSYPVAAELAALGFEWFSPTELNPLRRWLAAPDLSILEHNRAIATKHFSLEAMTRDIKSLLGSRGWLP